LLVFVFLFGSNLTAWKGPKKGNSFILYSAYFLSLLLVFDWQGEELKVNCRKEVQLRDDATGYWLELDLWLPQLNLAFEYQVLFFPFSFFINSFLSLFFFF
jgi:hypothetical protein